MANSFIAMHCQHLLLRFGRSAVSRPVYLNGVASGDVSWVLVVLWHSPLPHGRGSKRAWRVQGACRVWGFPPPSRSGLQKSVSCLGCLSCFGDAPLPHGRGSKKACRVWGACRALATPPPLRSGLQKSVSCLGCLSCLGVSPPSRSGLQKSVSCLASLSCFIPRLPPT